MHEVRDAGAKMMTELLFKSSLNRAHMRQARDAVTRPPDSSCTGEHPS